MAQQQKLFNGLLTKRPFYRIRPNYGNTQPRIFNNLAEHQVSTDRVTRAEVTQADFVRELDTDSHSINNREIYKAYMQKDDDGKYYEVEIPRYAFPFQQEILDDRLARLTGNDIQFDLADIDKGKKGWDTYNVFKSGWADKGMERAWHFLAKSVLSTGDGAFVGVLNEGVFYWKVLSYSEGDVLYPHYDRYTGKLKLFARTYSTYDDDWVIRKHIDVWDKTFYYRFVESADTEAENGKGDVKADTGTIQIDVPFGVEGYKIEEKKRHGFDRVPIAYKRCETGPCWSLVQELIEHYEASFSRLAQSNSEFGLPILGLYGDGKDMEEIATGDMSYASKIFLIPQDGKAEFLQRQDASPAYKTELDEVRKKIYEGAMVVKAPELKSGDTPAAAIKLLYSDSYNKALLESQEYDECVGDMIYLFKYGYGVETEKRLQMINTRIVYYIMPHIPINDSEVTQNLSLAVQNKFLSKQTASEKFYHSTPNEWDRILKEQHEEQMHELLIEEQRLEAQGEQQVETQEKLAEIQTEQQVEVIEAQAKVAEDSENDDKTTPKVRSKKGSVATGRSAGRPRTVNTDRWGNRSNENNWQTWNSSH